MEYKNLLEVVNPTYSQLIYMKDKYNKVTLTEYMAIKWERKFNTRMTDKDYKQFRKEVETLQLDTFEIYAYMEDYYNI